MWFPNFAITSEWPSTYSVSHGCKDVCRRNPVSGNGGTHRNCICDLTNYCHLSCLWSLFTWAFFVGKSSQLFRLFIQTGDTDGKFTFFRQHIHSSCGFCSTGYGAETSWLCHWSSTNPSSFPLAFKLPRVGEGKAVCSPLCKQNTIPVFCLLSGACSPVHGQECLHLSPVQFSSVTQACLILWPHGLQHSRPPCPSPAPAAFSNSCPSSQWCHPIISSSIIPFSSCLQSFPGSGSFQMSHFFASGGQSIEISASASELSMTMQDWFPLGLTGLICLQSKGVSGVFSNITVEKHQFFSAQLSLWSSSHIHTWLLEKP